MEFHFLLIFEKVYPLNVIHCGVTNMQEANFIKQERDDSQYSKSNHILQNNFFQIV